MPTQPFYCTLYTDRTRRNIQSIYKPTNKVRHLLRSVIHSRTLESYSRPRGCIEYLAHADRFTWELHNAASTRTSPSTRGIVVYTARKVGGGRTPSRTSTAWYSLIGSMFSPYFHTIMHTEAIEIYKSRPNFNMDCMKNKCLIVFVIYVENINKKPIHSLEMLTLPR